MIDLHLEAVYEELVAYLEQWDPAGQEIPSSVRLLRKCLFQLEKLRRILNQHEQDDKWVVDYLVGSQLFNPAEIDARLAKTRELIPVISDARAKRSMQLLNPYMPLPVVQTDGESDAYGHPHDVQGGRERIRASE